MALNALANTSVETLLKDLEADRVKALLLWYLADTGVEAETQSSEKVQKLLDEITKLDAEATYNALGDLRIEDMVRFSVLNEFGEGFTRKKACEFLILAIISRFAAQSAMNMI